ncbi:MAG TPA: Glu/Leu/Phe/Val dehydrogenase dimerization domain-containing protein [Spirochaetota bacterium]|nr:Glu/Leu/Phe/Val dehydrogenase dimerization domain-containing protein [Spirochaetota bacterium]
MPNDRTTDRTLPRGITSSVFTGEDLNRLYGILRGNSELSKSTIERELGTALRRLDQGSHFLSGDIRDLGLGVEELAFIIEHNRYQEKSACADGQAPRIDVRGVFENRHLFFISEDIGLSTRVLEDIVSILRRERDASARLFAYRIGGPGGECDTRVLYLLSVQERAVGRRPGAVARDAVRSCAADLDLALTDAQIDEFLTSGLPSSVAERLDRGEERAAVRHLRSWIAMRLTLAGGEDISIMVEDAGAPTGVGTSERRVRVCVSRERLLEHLSTLHRVFERQGLRFIREYAEFLTVGGLECASVCVYLPASLLEPGLVSFIQAELFNRLSPLRPAPISAFEVRDLLRRMASMDDYLKISFIDELQKDRRKEYLMPLVALLAEPSAEIRARAFALVKNYLLNPTPDMKDDYYWCTLKDIFSAASVPFARERDRESRPLTDEEIVQLIRFSGVYFDDYVEPLTGKGFLFIRMAGHGIGKGGIRAHESHVSFSGEGALSTNMLFKTMGIGVPFYSAGKGGILGDTSFRGEDEQKRAAARTNVFRAYADFLYYRAGIGPLTDVPAGDVGVGGPEIGIMFDRLTLNVGADAAAIVKNTDSPEPARRLKRHFGVPVSDTDLMARIATDFPAAAEYAAPAITGKPGGHGLALRAGATGRGMVEVLAAQLNYRDYPDAALWLDPGRVDEALELDAEYTRRSRERMSRLTFAIQGFGKVGASFARFVDEIGAAVTMVSDVSGTVLHGRRIPNIAALTDFCAGGRALGDAPPDVLEGCEFAAGNTLLPLTAVVNVVVPSALENVIVSFERPHAGAVGAGRLACEYVLQGANGPVTCDAEDTLAERGIVSFPDILANSGGVLASYCEWLNGLIRLNGYAALHGYGFVHPIVHNMVMKLHPDAMSSDIRTVDEEAYRRAFRFILRHATVATIELSRACRISMKSAYLSLGIRAAAGEGRLTERFSFVMAKIRDGFAGGARAV